MQHTHDIQAKKIKCKTFRVFFPMVLLICSQTKNNGSSESYLFLASSAKNKRELLSFYFLTHPVIHSSPVSIDSFGCFLLYFLSAADPVSSEFCVKSPFGVTSSVVFVSWERENCGCR